MIGVALKFHTANKVKKRVLENLYAMQCANLHLCNITVILEYPHFATFLRKYSPTENNVIN